MKQKIRPVIDRIGRYRELLSDDDAAALEAVIKNPPPTAIRFNPLKTDPQATAEEFEQKKNWKLQPVPYCREGFTLLESPTPPGRTLEPVWDISTSMMPLPCCQWSCLNQLIIHTRIFRFDGFSSRKSTHLAPVSTTRDYSSPMTVHLTYTCIELQR